MKTTAPDLTEAHRHPGTGMDTKLFYLCGHKAISTGGHFRGRVPMRCAACNTKEPK